METRMHIPTFVPCHIILGFVIIFICKNLFLCFFYSFSFLYEYYFFVLVFNLFMANKYLFTYLGILSWKHMILLGCSYGYGSQPRHFHNGRFLLHWNFQWWERISHLTFNCDELFLANTMLNGKNVHKRYWKFIFHQKYWILGKKWSNLGPKMG